MRVTRPLLLLLALLWTGCNPVSEPSPQSNRPEQPDPFRSANVRDNTPRLPSGPIPLDERGSTVSVATLNCYWYLGEERSDNADKPRTTEDYNRKAGHLIGLLPNDAPLFVGLQEIGNDRDVLSLAHSATARYQQPYTPLFVQGKDSATGQDVGALFSAVSGWGISGKPFRASELERDISKHLVVKLTNGPAQLTICVVHLRVPHQAEGIEKQRAQNRALAIWATAILAFNPKANIIILGDFNESGNPGTPDQSLAELYKAKPPFIDTFDHFKGTPITHQKDLKAYDRILISDALFRGHSGLSFKAVEIRAHTQTRNRILYTDHFPVIATFGLSSH